jgi:hypothetical protein
MSVFAVKKRRVNPATLLYSAKPKIGKTTKLTELEKNLIINLEKNGADFQKSIPIIDASKMLTASPQDIKDLLLNDIRTKVLDIADIADPSQRHAALNRILNALIVLGRPYDYVSIDTITQADIDAEWAGTEMYMDSLQGKTWNREVIQGKPSTQWPRLKYGDKEYQSVLEIGQNGWRWSRTIMVDLLALSRQASKKCTIYVCHIKDKMLSKGDKGEVFIKDIALTGAVADIYSRNVDAIASVYKDEDELMITFKGNEDKTGGNRGDIGSYEGPFIWEKLFVEED